MPGPDTYQGMQVACAARQAQIRGVRSGSGRSLSESTHMIDLSHIVKKGVYGAERRNFRDKLAQREHYLRLDLNENLVGLSREQLESLLSTIRPETLSAYPDLSRIYRRMAAHVGVGEDQIVLTNGSDMGIKTLFDVCIGKGDHIVVHQPFFLMYAHYAEFFEATLDRVPVREEDWRPDAQAMLARVNSRTKMVVVESPNGNLGTSLTPQETEHMAAELARRNVLLVIDEAYLSCERDHSDHLPLLERHGNVVLVRTLSKANGLAGARLGVLVSTPAIARELYKVRSLYEISALTAIVAEWHLDHPEVLEDYRNTVRAGKRYLAEQCARLGIGFKDTQANFVLLELDPGQETELCASRLKEQGILIGMPFALAQLFGWARITVGDPTHCARLIGAVEALQRDRTPA